jgi:poly(hydroxyalkanoate) granule-associated protein
MLVRHRDCAQGDNMVKKIHKSASPKFDLPAGLMDSQLAQSVKESAQQIWLAGMGAFAKAQEGRQKVFEALIKEGMGLQRKTQSAAEEKIGEVTDRMSAMAGDVTAKAGQHWDKLESIFEQRTAKAMNKLGVPTAKDVDALIKRVDELAAAVARLSKAAPAKAAAKPAAKTAAKKAVRRSAARKTST